MKTDGPISRFFKRRVPVVNMEIWTTLMTVLAIAIALWVMRASGTVDWWVVWGV